MLHRFDAQAFFEVPGVRRFQNVGQIIIQSLIFLINSNLHHLLPLLLVNFIRHRDTIF